MSPSPASSVRSGFPLGLTGAQAATRYVGATSSGAPASGTFAVGDFCIDQTGKVFVCTAAGSPGTWSEIGSSSGGGQVDYAQITANVQTSSGAEIAVVTTSGFTADGTSEYLIEFYCSHLCTFAGSDVAQLHLREDPAGANTVVGLIAQATSGSTVQVPVYAAVKRTPAAGTRVYRVTLRRFSGTQEPLVVAGAGGALGTSAPAFLRVSRV